MAINLRQRKHTKNVKVRKHLQPIWINVLEVRWDGDDWKPLSEQQFVFSQNVESLVFHKFRGNFCSKKLLIHIKLILTGLNQSLTLERSQKILFKSFLRYIPLLFHHSDASMTHIYIIENDENRKNGLP